MHENKYEVTVRGKTMLLSLEELSALEAQCQAGKLSLQLEAAEDLLAKFRASPTLVDFFRSL